MSFRVAGGIEQIRKLAYEYDDMEPYLSDAELAEQYRESLSDPTDEDAEREEDRTYAYAVWDAVNKRWVEDV